MSAWFKGVMQNNTARVLLIIPATFVGLLLPLDFLYQVDGFLMYVRPGELMPVFGAAWVFYALLGLAVAAVALGVSAGLAAVLRRDFLSIATYAGNWVSLSITGGILIRHVRLFMISIPALADIAFGLMRNQWWFAAAVFLIFALLLLRRQTADTAFNRGARFGARLSTLAALLAPVFFLFQPARPESRPAAGAAAPAHAPNIVLLTVDAFAADHLSVYGYGRPTTPGLETFAHDATVFDRYYANGNFTTAATNSFINGIRPWTHRVNQVFAQVDPALADRGLVARLHQSGYQTFAVATNPDAAPFYNGNDRWLDAAAYGRLRESLSILQSAVVVRFPHFMPVTNQNLVVITCKLIDYALVFTRRWAPNDHYDPELAFASARGLLQAADPARPAFLWVHLLAPHAPYATTPPYLGRFDRSAQHRTRFDSTSFHNFYSARASASPVEYIGRYDESVANTDAHLGRFLDWLKSRSLYDNALVIVSADHGESFTHLYGAHGGPMLYESIIRVPLLIKEPHQAAGGRCAAVSEQIDLMPTVLELAGLPAADQVEGRSLVPAIRGGAGHTVFSMNFEQNNRFAPFTTGSVAMIDGPWKYVRYLGHIHYPYMPALENTLVNLLADPAETANVAGAHPAIAERMNRAIEDELARHNSPRS